MNDDQLIRFQCRDHVKHVAVLVGADPEHTRPTSRRDDQVADRGGHDVTGPTGRYAKLGATELGLRQEHLGRRDGTPRRSRIFPLERDPLWHGRSDPSSPSQSVVACVQK